MDSISAPTAEGTYQTVFGRLEEGLFLQRLDHRRFCFRHAGSGLSLFYFLGAESGAVEVLRSLAARYDFHRDSIWVLKSQGEIHRELVEMQLTRQWIHRAWHYTASVLGAGQDGC